MKTQTEIITSLRERNIQNAKRKLEELEKQLETFTSPVVVTVLPLDDLMKKHLPPSRDYQYFTEKLSELREVNVETKIWKYFIVVLEMITAFAISYIYLGRMVSAQTLDEIVPDIFGFGNPVLTFSIVEAIAMAVISVLFHYLISLSFNRYRLIYIRMTFILGLAMFISSIIWLNL